MPADLPRLHEPADAPPAADVPPWAGEVVALLRELLAAVKANQGDQPPHSSAKAFLSFTDLVERTGFSLSALERMRSKGQLPPAVPGLGRSVRFRASDVQAWLDGCPPQNKARCGRRR